MADAENETHSSDLPVLQPLSSTYFVSEKAYSSQKEQEQPHLQTCLNNGFQIFADTLMSKFENLTNKSPFRTKAKGKRLRKGRQSDDGKASSKPSSDSEGELEEQMKQREKNKKLRLIPLELRLTRGKNATKGQVMMNQSMNMMTGSVFMPMMTVNWLVT